MSESNQGGNPPPHNPYGQQGGGENPYGAAPFGGRGGQSGQQPYGPPPAESPYAQPVEQQHGAAPAEPDPYGAAPAPYEQQHPIGGGPLGDGLDMYGRPLGTDSRPGTVAAAGWITLILSGLTALLYTFVILALLVVKDEILPELDRALAEQGTTGDFSAEDAYGVFLAVMVVLTLWSVVACVLAVFAMRRSNVARIMLVISSSVAALLGLLGIQSLVSAVWVAACVAVVILLFTGGAGDWYARRRRY